MSAPAVRVFYDADADPTRLRDRVVAVIGYGSQGHAHALNLRDSGVRVIVGLRPGGASWERARVEGLDVRPIADAAAAASVVMVLVPDQEARAVYEAGIARTLGPGKTLLFAHGFNIHFGEIVPPPSVDVAMIAPKSPGHMVRSEYQAGRGVPALVAVQRDASGHALADALAYAAGIGCTRAGVLETSFKEETETDLFGEQAVLCGGVTALVQAGFGVRGSERTGAPRAPSPEARAPQDMTPRTLFAKLWDAHVVHRFPEGPALLYVDLHLVHEVTSPQAFAGLRQARRRVRRPELTVATVDHNVPTGDRSLPIEDPVSARQLDALAVNAREFGVELFDLHSASQGIVPVIGPELGLTQPGMIIVCGDSHTSTHGAFGALAVGIGTSEVEHVLATQCLVWSEPRTMEACLTGTPGPGVTAKDLILALIGAIGTAGAAGHVIEYAGDAIRALSMEERMTVCNMSIEAGARAGMIAPDDTTFAYLAGRPRAPRGAGWED